MTQEQIQRLNNLGVYDINRFVTKLVEAYLSVMEDAQDV
jgi:hypothetical protein